MDFEYELHVFRSPAFQSVVNEAVDFFVQTPVHPLPPPKHFLGPGVYALYYAGNYQPYKRIAQLNHLQCIMPIYAGKAVPPGWRTARSSTSETADLYARLREHAQSIRQTTNIALTDFRCRFMILNGLESELIGTVEARLIRRYKPLWNTVIDGFGNHDPGAGRYNQARSEWDALHPGRVWAERLMGSKPDLDDLLEKIDKALSGL